MPSTIPTQCQTFVSSMASAKAQVQALQARLPRASPAEKTRIARMIASLQDTLEALDQSLSSCIKRYTVPHANEPWQQTKRIDILQAEQSLNTLLASLQLRLHNVGSGDHRHSTFNVSQSIQQEPYASLPGFPKDLGQLTSGSGVFDPDFHFNDVNSKRMQLVFDAEAFPPLRLNLAFETQGEEVIVNNWFNKDYSMLVVEIDLDLIVDHRVGLLSLNVGDIHTTARTGDHDDTRFETAFSQKVREQLEKFSIALGQLLTDRLLQTDRQHFDYKVLRVSRSNKFWEVVFTKKPKPILTA